MRWTRIRLLTVAACLMLIQMNLSAQMKWQTDDSRWYQRKGTTRMAKASIAVDEEAGYDIQYIKFDLLLNATSVYIQGNVTTTAKVTAAKLTKYVFELSDSLTIDSVKINEVSQSFDVANGICRTSLTAPIDSGKTFTAQVFYRGYASDASAINSPGFHNAEGVTFSSVEPYFADTWWPCKQSLTDKIDSVDMWITVPDSVKVGSNGILTAVTPAGTGYHRYEWKERYPIDYYLISVAVGTYSEYSYYMHFSGSSDSMLIMNYAPDTLLSRIRPMLDTTGLLVDYYSTLFGRYPFWKEKYGHCYSPSFVNMEHQTMTSTHLTRLTVIAHELVHQWFGDNVTCGSWKDIWLNEGFATYGQYLCYQHFNGQDTANSFMRTIHDASVAEIGGTVYSYDTTDPGRMFDGRLTYNKGAAVVHMLRFIAGDDTKFFDILKTYQQQYAGKTAITDDMEHIAATILNRDLYTFFHQWIFCDGFPNYDVAWNQVNGVAYIRIAQSASYPSSVSLYEMPIEIKLYSSRGDTTITVFDDQPEQVFGIVTDRVIDSIAFDPNHWLVYKLNRQPVRDNNLSRLPFDVEVYPNPATNTLNIVYKNLSDASFILYDISGRKMIEYKLPSSAGKEQVDIQFLPAGIYTYKAISRGTIRFMGKISKIR